MFARSILLVLAISGPCDPFDTPTISTRHDPAFEVDGTFALAQQVEIILRYFIPRIIVIPRPWQVADIVTLHRNFDSSCLAFLLDNLHIPCYFSPTNHHNMSLLSYEDLNVHNNDLDETRYDTLIDANGDHGVGSRWSVVNR